MIVLTRLCPSLDIIVPFCDLYVTGSVRDAAGHTITLQSDVFDVASLRGNQLCW